MDNRGLEKQVSMECAQQLADLGFVERDSMQRMLTLLADPPGRNPKQIQNFQALRLYDHRVPRRSQFHGNFKLVCQLQLHLEQPSQNAIWKVTRVEGQCNCGSLWRNAVKIQSCLVTRMLRRLAPLFAPWHVHHGMPTMGCPP